MIDIVPAILTDSEQRLFELIRRFEAAGVSRIHIDICDGQFVPTKTVSGYEQLTNFKTNVQFDVHLMVQQPREACGHWRSVSSADRFAVHVEAEVNIPELAQQVHGWNKKLGASLNPETPMQALERDVHEVDFVQFMTVHPGQQGSSLVPEALERMRQFAGKYPKMMIMADGGVTPDTALFCVQAGATTLVSGSYVVQSADPGEALAQLRAAANATA